MVLDSTAGVELLLDVGLDRRIVGSTEVEIRADGQQWSRRRVLLSRHSPSPAEVGRAVAAALKSHCEGVYFVVSKAGSALAEAAQRDLRVAYGAVDEGTVSFLGNAYQANLPQPGPPRPTRVSWTRLAIIRLLALWPQGPLTQAAIARLIGVSHVAVGKQLPALEGLAERTPDGWRSSDRTACWEEFMASYPGPQGLAGYFAATGDLAGQLARAEQAMARAGQQLTVSGDFAADFYAPWRRPARIIAYTSVQPVLGRHGFAAVPAADATIELRLPRDPTILAMSRTWALIEGQHRCYADPLAAAWDLSRSKGGDAAAAVEELRNRVIREAPWP